MIKTRLKVLLPAVFCAAAFAAVPATVQAAFPLAPEQLEPGGVETDLSVTSAASPRLADLVFVDQIADAAASGATDRAARADEGDERRRLDREARREDDPFALVTGGLQRFVGDYLDTLSEQGVDDGIPRIRITRGQLATGSGTDDRRARDCAPEVREGDAVCERSVFGSSMMAQLGREGAALIDQAVWVRPRDVLPIAYPFIRTPDSGVARFATNVMTILPER